MDIIRKNIKMKRPKIIITVPNIAFIVTRLSLLFGKFNYGKVGILDLTHTRLFTFRSLKELLIQSGYKIIDIQGVPAPYPKAIGNNIISKFLMFVNEVLIKISQVSG